MKTIPIAVVAACQIAAAAADSAEETVPFVVVEDTGGAVQDTPFDTNDHANTVVNALLQDYQSSGADLPEIMSVWTAFPFDGNTVETRFVPIKNDVTGIGLENAFGEGQEVFDLLPPMRAMLIHNDATALASRAQVQRLGDGDSVPAGFGEYLFLLELGHVWGPEIHMPSSTGLPPAAAIGFDFHWSFFLDAGGSPIGGNAWIDNGDGTFTARAFSPSTVTYAPLDLYLMGLGAADDVAPFGVLHDVTVPAGATDPFTGRALSEASFPWQGPDDLVVTGQRTQVTIDDVIAENGPRVPAFGAAPTSFTLGIVLVVPADLTGAARDDVVRAFAPLAANLAPSFARATGNRGTLDVITSSAAPPPPADDEDDPPPPSKHDDGDEDGGGCASTHAAPATATLVGLLAAALLRRRR